MPIDPNIALGYRGIEVPNPLAGMAQVTQIQNALQQQQIGQMQLKQLQEDRQEMQALQAKLAQMGKNPDMSVLAETLMRSPKTLEKGIELRRKLDQQAGFERFLAGQNPASVTAAAPATAGAAAQPSPNVETAMPVPMTRTTNAPPIEVKPDEAYPATMPPRAAENALAPQPTGVNAMRQLRTPEAIRAEMMQLAQFSDVPQAKAYMKALETELAEAMKPQVVSPGQAVYQGGRLVVSRPETPTTLQREFEQAKSEGFKGTLLDYKRQVAEAGRPVTNVEIKQEAALGQALGTQQAKAIAEGRDAAMSAVTMLDTINTGRKILDSGAITGAGADFLVGLNQALKTAGIDAGMADASANSQAFAATMAGSVGQLIKQFGAGTGLSDADREYAKQMAGGKITLDEKAIRKILDINERASRNVIIAHNKSIDKAGKQAEWFRVDMPTPEAAPTTSAKPRLSAADQEALDWATANPNDPRSAQVKQHLRQKYGL